MGRLGGHYHSIGYMSVQNEHLRAAHMPAAARLRSFHAYAFAVPAAVLFGERHGRDGRASGYLRQQFFFGGFVVAAQQGVDGQGNRGEERRAQQGTTHLFQHHHKLYVAEALAAVLLWDDEALKP